MKVAHQEVLLSETILTNWISIDNVKNNSTESTKSMIHLKNMTFWLKCSCESNTAMPSQGKYDIRNEFWKAG